MPKNSLIQNFEHLEKDSSEIVEEILNIEVRNPYFEVIPAHLITSIARAVFFGYKLNCGVLF